MGMKSRPKTRSWYRMRIRGINDRIVGIRREDPDDPRLAKLISVKDELTDELTGSCDHASLIESPSEEGFEMMSWLPARGCLLCGEVEHATSEWLRLRGPVESVSRRVFTIRIDRVRIDLGIDISR